MLGWMDVSGNFSHVLAVEAKNISSRVFLTVQRNQATASAPELDEPLAMGWVLVTELVSL